MTTVINAHQALLLGTITELSTPPADTRRQKAAELLYCLCTDRPQEYLALFAHKDRLGTQALTVLKTVASRPVDVLDDDMGGNLSLSQKYSTHSRRYFGAAVASGIVAYIAKKRTAEKETPSLTYLAGSLAIALIADSAVANYRSWRHEEDGIVFQAEQDELRAQVDTHISIEDQEHIGDLIREIAIKTVDISQRRQGLIRRFHRPPER